MKQNILELIGKTPLVEISKLDTGCCQLFVKLENQNPGGSIKDRIGLSMIESAEHEGKIKPGDTLIEATAGNTGLGLALVAAIKGYKLILVIPDKMSQEKIFHLQALGATIELTRSDVEKGHPDYYQDKAKRLADKYGAYYIDQFNNPANPLAHERSTGPEIWDQTSGMVDAVVCGVGSSGTLLGLSHFFAKQTRKVRFILADPRGSVLAPYVESGKVGQAGSWIVEGIGEDFIPAFFDPSLITKAYTIDDRESLLTANELLLKEGIFGGATSGTLLAAALRYCREQERPQTVVTFICDSGNKYLSKMYNHYWMIDHGFVDRHAYGDLRDVISRRFQDQAVVTVTPDDSLSVAIARMKLYDISQLPVVVDDRVVGIVDESDLLLALQKSAERLKDSIKSVMTSVLLTVTPKTPIDQVVDMLRRGLVAIVADDTGFYGLITRSDLITYLRRKYEGS